MAFKILQEIGTGSSNDGELLEIVGFDGKEIEGKPTLTVLGQDSNKFRSVQSLLQKDLRGFYRDDKDYIMSEDEAVERRVRLVSSCIVDWDNLFDEHNQKILWTVEGASELLSGSPYLLDLVDSFLSSRANYLAK